VGVLAAVLTTAGAAPAHARDLDPASRAWHWLQEVWTQRLSALWDWGGAGKPEKGAPSRTKQGAGRDPNGSPKPASATPSCDTCTDQGYGLDPNG